jgi:hypothetical protein
MLIETFISDVEHQTVLATPSFRFHYWRFRCMTLFSSRLTDRLFGCRRPCFTPRVLVFAQADITYRRVAPGESDGILPDEGLFERAPYSQFVFHVGGALLSGSKTG